MKNIMGKYLYHEEELVGFSAGVFLGKSNVYLHTINMCYVHNIKGYCLSSHSSR